MSLLECAAAALPEDGRPAGWSDAARSSCPPACRAAPGRVLVLVSPRPAAPPAALPRSYSIYRQHKVWGALIAGAEEEEEAPPEPKAGVEP